jgi:predicted transcriptional regulator of viral defense system
MKRQELTQRLEALGKNYFSMHDLRKLFPEEDYLRTSAKRMLDAGVIFQIAHGLYALKQENLDLEKLATQLYYPSYISFESALSKYDVINQGLYGLSLATTRHSKKITLAGLDCEYSQIKPALFFGFDLINGTYLAQAEKAFLDLVYLMCLGKRTGSTSEWHLDLLDKDKLAEYIPFYPQSVKNKISGMGLLF